MHELAERIPSNNCSPVAKQLQRTRDHNPSIVPGLQFIKRKKKIRSGELSTAKNKIVQNFTGKSNYLRVHISGYRKESERDKPA